MLPVKKEIAVTNARIPETTSFMVASTMEKLGYGIRVDRTDETNHILSVLSSDGEILGSFMELTDTPDIQILCEALEGLDIRNSKLFARCSWSEETKVKITAFALARKADVLRSMSHNWRDWYFERAQELDKEIAEILSEGTAIPDVAKIQSFVDKIVRKKLERKTSY